MVDGAASRLREYRRLLPSGDLADALDGRFWDAVVLTAANERQALVYARQLDGLHARGQLPGSRDRYVVFPDPPGPRVGSGGATLNVMLRLQASVGHAWASRRILLLHAGGYSERSPAHGTLGKAFGQLPMDAAGVGVPATILEAQLVYLQDLPAALPPGVFVSSADVVLQMARVPPSTNAFANASPTESSPWVTPVPSKSVSDTVFSRATAPNSPNSSDDTPPPTRRERRERRESPLGDVGVSAMPSETVRGGAAGRGRGDALTGGDGSSRRWWRRVGPHRFGVSRRMARVRRLGSRRRRRAPNLRRRRGVRVRRFHAADGRGRRRRVPREGRPRRQPGGKRRWDERGCWKWDGRDDRERDDRERWYGERSLRLRGSVARGSSTSGSRVAGARASRETSSRASSASEPFRARGHDAGAAATLRARS